MECVFCFNLIGDTIFPKQNSDTLKPKVSMDM